jgi:hypothetical protein
LGPSERRKKIYRRTRLIEEEISFRYKHHQLHCAWLDTRLGLPCTVFCVTYLLTYVTSNNRVGPHVCCVN